jgi:hypothetical protein
MQVRELPENPPPGRLPPLQTDEMKESTPPAAITPLVPHQRDKRTADSEPVEVGV